MPAGGLYHRITVLDLILPRVLVGERIGKAERALLVVGVYVKTVQNVRIRTVPSVKACEALSEIHKNASFGLMLIE